MKKIKVLHIIKTFNLGGAETNLLNMIRNTDRSRIEPYVAYSFGGPFEASFRELGIPLFKYSSKEVRVQSLESFLIVWKLANYLKKHQIKIVHTHTYNAQVWGSLAARLAGAKTVEHVHDFRYESEDYLRANGIARPEQLKQAGRFAKLSERIVVLTENNRAFLTANQFADSRKVKIIPNSIPMNEAPAVQKRDLLEELKLPHDKKIIFWAVRLSPEKNPAFVLDIAQDFSDREDVIFVVAGDGPLRTEMEAAVLKRALAEKVRLIGFYPEPLKLLSICDIAIQPTFLELHSIMMMEAMSVRKPVLVSKDVGCNNDFITHGVNGYLLNPRNAKEWSAAIQDLLDHPEKAFKLGEAGRRLLEERCTMQRLNRDFESLYQEIAS